MILRNQKELTEVRDSEGRIVGIFTPVSQSAQWSEPGKNYSTREIFELLQTLTTDDAVRGYLQGKIQELKKRQECAAP